MTELSSERRLVIASRMAPGYMLSEGMRKHLQHVFMVWFPRAIYRDLTNDTVKVEVTVRKSSVSERNVYATSFVNSDGAIIKTIEYDEDRLTGAQCPSYDQLRSGYCGTKDGVDFRLVVYDPGAR